MSFLLNGTPTKQKRSDPTRVGRENYENNYSPRKKNEYPYLQQPHDYPYEMKTQKINFKPPPIKCISAIYMWAGYEFCLSKDILNEKSLKDLKKKYKYSKDLPLGIDYNSIHSASSLHPEFLRTALQDHREYLMTTQIVSPAKFESLFNYLHRVHKLRIKTEKKDEKS